MYPDRVVSGMRPTGVMHLGHFHGALKNLVTLQNEHECLFFVADWHALTTHYDDPSIIEKSTWDMVIDWLAAGIDPAKATLFIQSNVPEHAEGHAAGLAGTGADLQGSDRQAEGPRPRDLRFPRLSAAAGGRRADLPRQHGAGRRGPGAARGNDARAVAPLQPYLRPRKGLRGKGARGGEEAGRQARPQLRAP